MGGGGEAFRDELIQTCPGRAVDAEVLGEEVDGLGRYLVEPREVRDHRHAAGQSRRGVGQLLEARVVRAPVDGVVIAPQHGDVLGIVEQRRASGQDGSGDVGHEGVAEDEAVAYGVLMALGQPDGAQAIHELDGLRWQAEPVRLVQMTQSFAALAELPYASLEFGVDPVDLLRGLRGVGVQYIADAGERDAGLGEGNDAGQVDDRLRCVASVAGGVPRGFGQQSFGVVDTDGLG